MVLLLSFGLGVLSDALMGGHEQRMALTLQIRLLLAEQVVQLIDVV